MQKKLVIDPCSDSDYRVICQNGVKQSVLPKSKHNASWDSVLTDGNKLILSLCSELTTSEYAKLAQYDYKTNQITELFYSKKYIMPHERLIRDSKFHTSIAELENGDLIMATHTTDKAPEHPAWLLEGYYSNIWEGFQGSTLFIYKKDGTVENLGIPVPRESIYGAVYDRKHRNYYMLGFLRGHLYCYNLDSRTTKDLGQVTERHTYKLIKGPDENIYFTTRSGYLKKINVDNHSVEFTGHCLPNSCETKKLARSYMACSVVGPDKQIYIAGQFHDEISVYDCKTNTLVNKGSYKSAENYTCGMKHNDYVGGMAFDKNGVLWIVVCALRHDKEEDYKPPSSLIRWDILKDEAPVFCGIVGTASRVTTTTTGVHCDKEKNILYVVSTNHADEGVDVVAIDINVFDKGYRNLGPVTQDKYVFPNNLGYQEHAKSLRNTWKVIGENGATFLAKKIIPVRVWLWLNYVEVEKSAVSNVYFEDETIIAAIDQGNIELVVSTDGQILRQRKTKHQENNDIKNFSNLPYYPGRQYKAFAHLSCELFDGSHLVSTKDGLLAVANDQKVFAIGAPANNGPINAMVATKDKKTVYGVAGDVDDLGVVFKFNVDDGLRILGRLATDGSMYGAAASCNLSSIAISKDDNLLVIGASDRLGGLYMCSL